MAERSAVACPGGHPIMTTVRARSTTCPQCGRRVYVRADGTTRHGQAARAERSAGAPWARREYQTPQRFRWGRERWDGKPDPSQVGRREYDARAGRTKLFDQQGGYMGWMEGDPYSLAGEG